MEKSTVKLFSIHEDKHIKTRIVAYTASSLSFKLSKENNKFVTESISTYILKAGASI